MKFALFSAGEPIREGYGKSWSRRGWIRRARSRVSSAECPGCTGVASVSSPRRPGVRLQPASIRPPCKPLPFSAASITRHQQLLCSNHQPQSGTGNFAEKSSFLSNPGVEPDCSGPIIDSKNARHNIDLEMVHCLQAGSKQVLPDVAAPSSEAHVVAAAPTPEAALLQQLAEAASAQQTSLPASAANPGPSQQQQQHLTQVRIIISAQVSN